MTKKKTVAVEKKTTGRGRELDTKVLGVSGLRHSSGVIQMEEHPRLRGKRGPALYREMASNDSIIGGIIYIIKTRVKQVEWRFEPSDENDQEAVEWAQFVESCFDDMAHTFEDFISEVMSVISQGWVLFEICWKRREGQQDDSTRNSKYDDGYVGIRKLSVRHQQTLDRWELDDDDGIAGMWQAPPNGGALCFIPIEKALLFRVNVSANNPEGVSMLRNGQRSYLYKKRLEEVEAIGAERDLAGLPVLQLPEELMDPSASDAQKQMVEDYKELVQDVRRDEREGIVIPCEVDADGKPTGYKFALLSSGGARQMDVDKMIRRYESRMAMTMLMEFLLLGTDKAGSWSMHSDKTDMAAIALRALTADIAATINRHLIRRLALLNGCPPEKIPILQHGDVAKAPLAEMSAFVQAMSNAGMLQYDPRLERWVRALAGMPEPEDTQPGLAGVDVTNPIVRPTESQQTDEEEVVGSEQSRQVTEGEVA